MERPQEWVRGHESAQEMLRRVLPAAAADAAAAHSSSTPLLPCLGRLSHGQAVVEVAGASGSAKSVFLLEVMLSFIVIVLFCFVSGSDMSALVVSVMAVVLHPIFLHSCGRRRRHASRTTFSVIIVSGFRHRVWNNLLLSLLFCFVLFQVQT